MSQRHKLFWAREPEQSRCVDKRIRRFLSPFRDSSAIDSSVMRINRILGKVFASVHKGQAAIKLHTKFSIRSLTPTKVQVTESKRHDSRFCSITNEPNILYLFDLAYFAFYRFWEDYGCR